MKKKEKKKLIWPWVVLAAVSLPFVVCPFVFKAMQWPGGVVMMVFWPIFITLLVVAFYKIAANKNRQEAVSEAESTLRVDYRASYAIRSTMLTKRHWAMAMTAVAAVIFAVQIAGMLIYGMQPMTWVAIATALLFMVLGITTARYAKKVVSAMQGNSQELFEKSGQGLVAALHSCVLHHCDDCPGRIFVDYL